MLKTAFLTLLSLAIAIIGGGGSVWYALKVQDGVARSKPADALPHQWLMHGKVVDRVGWLYI